MRFLLVERPEEGGEPVEVAEMRVHPDGSLIGIEIELGPIHVCMVIVARVIAQELHGLIVRGRDSCKPRCSFIQLFNDGRQVVPQPGLPRGTKGGMRRALLQVVALHLPL